jgi:hypothetical protein
MAAQQGFQYEENASDALKKLGFVPSNFKPAGAGHDQPDLKIKYKNKEAGCELKITDASAGSLVIKYTPRTKQWGFDESSRDDKEKAFIMDVADDVGLLDQIKANWTAEPYKIDKQYQTTEWKNTVGQMSSRSRYERDLAFFKDLKGPIPAEKIEQYYNKKDTYYVNIGTHGFYLFGSSNPLGFSKLQKFSNCADAGWRARVQYKGSDNYQFTFEMNFKVRTRSSYNIAPITKNNVSILEQQIKLPS